MSETDVASNAAPETVAPVETVNEAQVSETPSASNMEALDRAFAKVEADDGGAPKVQQSRDETGKFKASEPEPEQAEQPEPAKPPTITIAPPTRLSPQAKEAWEQTPEPVRVEVDRAIGELTKGIETYQARWEPLRQFDEMAKAGGTTLPDALGRYINLENLLRTDPVAGMLAVCQNMKIDPAQMAEAMTQPDAGQRQRAAVESQHAQQLEQKLAALEAQIEQQRAESQIAAFAQANPRMSEDQVRATMAQALQSGFATTMQDAYDKATRIVPAAPDVSAPTIPVRPQTPKPAPKQITGSPSGSNPATRPPAGSSREALDRAFASVGL